MHGQRIPFQRRGRFLCQRIVVLVFFSCLLIGSCKSVKGGEVEALRLQRLLIQRDGILGFSICQRDLRHISKIFCLGVIRAMLAAHSIHTEEDVRAVIIAGIRQIAPAAGDVGMTVVLAGALLDVVDIIAVPPHHLAGIRRIFRIPIVGQMRRLSQCNTRDTKGVEGNGAGTGDVDAHTAHLQPDPHGRIILPFCRCPFIPRLAGTVGQVEIKDLVMEGEGVFIIPLLPVFLSKVRAADIIGGQEARDLVREHESVSRNILRLHLLWRGGIGLRGFLPDLGADVVMRPLELVVVCGRAHHKAHLLYIQLGKLHRQHLVQIPVFVDLIPLHRLGLTPPVEAHHAGVHPPVIHGHAVGQGKRRHHPLIQRLVFTLHSDIFLVLGIELAQHREAVQIVLCGGCLIGVIPPVCLRLAAVDIAAQHLGIAEQPLHARGKVRVLLHFRGQRVIARLFHQPALEQQCFVGRVCCFFRRSSAELSKLFVIPCEGQDILTAVQHRQLRLCGLRCAAVDSGRCFDALLILHRKTQRRDGARDHQGGQYSGYWLLKVHIVSPLLVKFLLIRVADPSPLDRPFRLRLCPCLPVRPENKKQADQHDRKSGQLDHHNIVRRIRMGPENQHTLHFQLGKIVFLPQYHTCKDQHQGKAAPQRKAQTDPNRPQPFHALIRRRFCTLRHRQTMPFLHSIAPSIPFRFSAVRSEPSMYQNIQ